MENSNRGSFVTKLQIGGNTEPEVIPAESDRAVYIPNQNHHVNSTPVPVLQIQPPAEFQKPPQTSPAYVNPAYVPDAATQEPETAAPEANGTQAKDAFVPDIQPHLRAPVKAQNVNVIMEEKDKDKEEEDPWKVDSLKQDYTPWNKLNTGQKRMRVFSYIVKIILVLAFLYLFICSLDFLSSAFKLLGGRKAGEVFQNSDLLCNPVAGLMMGVLVTVLVQSSSTSTSIIISMVASELLTVKTAVPIIMGANIGTSVTNTIVSFGQITDKSEFRRAFAGATVHDMFNLMSVVILLPLEVISGYLFHLSDAIVDSLHLNETLDVNQDLLKTITKPFTTLIVHVSSSDIKKIATGEKDSEDATLMKFCCDDTKPEKCCDKDLEELSKDVYPTDAGTIFHDPQRSTVCQAIDHCVMKDYTEEDPKLQDCIDKPWERVNIYAERNVSTLKCDKLGDDDTMIDCCNDQLQNAAFYTNFQANATAAEKEALCTLVNNDCFSGNVYKTCIEDAWETGRLEYVGQRQGFACKAWTKDVERDCNDQCDFLFRSTHESQGGPLSDEEIGAILLVLSLILLCVCLVCIVKLLQSLLKGPIAKVIKTFVNADFPGYCGYFTGYLAILLGAGFTILVQSSSIFTSTLTPLVGLGVIELERMYPLTLGSNIGTTATGVLAALAQDVDAIPRALQVAFCHLFFNISGIIIFYPLPFFRPPINAAKFLGNTTAKYRWFAILYLIFVFFLIPLAIFGLSVEGMWVMGSVLIPIGVVFLAVLIVKLLQYKAPSAFPPKMRNWKWLPKPLRSLEPYDRVMRKVFFCKGFQHQE